jgi:hypothetical protein
MPVFSGFNVGEPGGIRTHDPMIKSHVLYQLSYGLAWRINTPDPKAFSSLAPECVPRLRYALDRVRI